MTDAKVVDEKAFTGLLDQQETNYLPLSPTDGKACANCRWFKVYNWNNDPPSCHLIADWPEPILATGLCDRWEGPPAPPVPDLSNPLPVVIVPLEEMEMALPTTGKGLVETIVTVVKKMLQPSAPAPATSKEESFTVFKAADGKHYWLARHTGKFKDREGEILADKAHEEYVERVQKGLVPMPELWTWHTKGTRHGQADLVWKSGGFLLALGHFDDTPEAKHAIEFYEKNAGKIKLSHMFHYPTTAKQKGVYYAYNTIEITTLPDGAEAFPYTSFEEMKFMPLSDQQREFIRGVGGDEMLKRAEAADTKAVADTKTLEALGVESKGLDNFTGASIPASEGDVQALKVVQADLETRLKAVESLPDRVKAQDDLIKALIDQVAASQTAESAALAKANDLEKQFLEYKALKPRASESDDTVLNEREKSFLDQVLNQAKAENQPSLVDSLVGGQTTVATGV